MWPIKQSTTYKKATFLFPKNQERPTGEFLQFHADFIDQAVIFLQKFRFLGSTPPEFSRVALLTFLGSASADFSTRKFILQRVQQGRSVCSEFEACEAKFLFKKHPGPLLSVLFYVSVTIRNPFYFWKWKPCPCTAGCAVKVVYQSTNQIKKTR